MRAAFRAAIAALVAIASAASLRAEGIVVLSPSVESSSDAASVPGSAELGAMIAGAFRSADGKGAFSFAVDDSFAGKPVSAIDAYGYAERTGAGYLLYGKARFASGLAELELSLFDKEGGGKRKTFYAKGEEGDLGALAAEIAGKAVAYLYGVMGVAEGSKEVAVRIFVPVEAEGWVPYIWQDLLIGTARVGTGVIFEPAKPLASNIDEALYFRFGAGLSYGLGLSTPGHPEAVEHDMRLSLPLELSAEFVDGGRLALTLGPLRDLGLFAIAQPYGSTLVTVQTAFGGAAYLRYEFKVSAEGTGFGPYAGLTALLLEPFYLEFQFGLRICIKAGEA